MKIGENVNKYFEMFARIFEELSQINNTNLNSHDLLFESIITYYLSGNYVRSQLLANGFEEFNLPNFKKYILSFLNKKFEKLREEILDKFNSNEFNEEFIITQLNNNEINKVDAFCKIFDFYTLQTINYAINYVYSGDEKFINLSHNIIRKYKNMSFKHDFVEYWWGFQILDLLIKKLFENSLWHQLDSFKDDTNKLTHLFIENKINNSIIELLDSQTRAIELITHEDRVNFCINTPTSSGKTLIAELTILQFLIDTNCSEKIIYISPFRSLSHEIENKLKKSFKNFNLTISEFYGGFNSNVYESIYLEDIDIFIVTPEKFDYIMRMNPQLKNDIGLIIIDEGHIIGKSNERGLNFEFFIYRIQHYYENCRFVFISGVIPNISDFSQLFANNPENIISSNWKPTDVYVGLLEWKNKNANITYLSKNGTRIKNKTKMLFYKQAEEINFVKTDNFQLAISAFKLSMNGSTFVYIRNKNEIETLAKTIVDYSDDLLNMYNITSKVHEKDLDLIEFKKMLIDEFGDKSIYLKYIGLGFFIHHKDLPEHIKTKIEELFKLNKLSLIIGTTTLINGVNFPIKNIILKNLQTGRQYMDHHSFNNLCGRAGRAKIENKGRVFLYLSDLNKSNNKKNVNYLMELITTQKNVNSFFTYLFRIFENNGINLEKSKSELEFYEKINESISKINEPNKIFIENIDKQLLAYLEENKNKFSQENLIKDVVDNSLFSIQTGNDCYMENYLKSRLYFIKKEYNNKTRRKIYECGLTLYDFNLVNSKKEDLCDYIKQLNKWYDYTQKEQENLLIEIAIFISKLKMGSDLSEEKDYKLILKYWIKQKNIIEIITILNEKYGINKKEKDIVAFINECKYILPWGMTCILNYVFNNCKIMISDNCYNIIDMFKFGTFDLNISILMPIFNDIELCKELSEFIDINSSIPDIIFTLKMIDANSISKKNREKFIKFKTNTKNSSNRLIIENNNDVEINNGEQFLIKKESENLMIYNLEGDYIFKCPLSTYSNLEYYDEINNINKIWSVTQIYDKKIYLN